MKLSGLHLPSIPFLAALLFVVVPFVHVAANEISLFEASASGRLDGENFHTEDVSNGTASAELSRSGANGSGFNVQATANSSLLIAEASVTSRASAGAGGDAGWDELVVETPLSQGTGSISVTFQLTGSLQVRGQVEYASAELQCSLNTGGVAANPPLSVSFNARLGETGEQTISETFTFTDREFIFDNRTGLFPLSFEAELEADADLTASGEDPASVEVTGRLEIVSLVVRFPGDEPDGHHWINSTGGDFATAANWDPEEVPGASETAIFDAPGTYTVNVGDRILERLLVGGEPSLHVTFTNPDLTVQSTDPDPAGIVINHGNFTLNDGTIRGVHGIVGSSSATQATITSGLWTNQATLTIGGGGEATLLVEDGGRVCAPIVRVGNAANAAFGTVSLNGGTLEAAQLDVGRAGIGTLAITNGGTATVNPILFTQVDSNDPLYQLLVGVGESGSSGYLFVRGVDPISNEPSTLSVIDVTAVAGAGGANAQIVIDDGGFVEMTPGLVLGQGAGSLATLTVRGQHAESGQRSTLLVNNLGSNELFRGDLSISGFEGRAEMQIDGGHVKSTRGEVGNASGLPGLGLVEIINQGRWEVEQDLVLAGDSGTSLTVMDGLLRIGDLQETWDPNVAFTPILSIGSGVVGGGGEGTLRLTGFFSDLQLAPRNIDVGENGTGELIIESGARLSGAFQLYTTQVYEQEPGAADLADRATIRVTGFSTNAAPGDPAARSTLQLESTTDLSGIGINDYAEMFIENGAVVSCALLGVGGQPATRGRIVVDGSGNGLPSTLIANEWITIGDLAHGGAGTMEVTNGAVVSTRELTVEGSGIVFFDEGGGIILGDGDEAVPNVLRLNNGGRLAGDGTLVGRLEDNGGVDNFAGTVLPGTSPGTLTIEGHYWQGINGVLEIELGGLEAGSEHDVLAVSGTATFDPGTTIRIILIDPNPDDDINAVFIPRTGDDFSFLLADEIMLPAGTTLNDLVEFSNLPADVEIDLQLDLVNGKTVVTATTTASVPTLTLRSLADGRLELTSSEVLAGAVESSISLEPDSWAPLLEFEQPDPNESRFVIPAGEPKRFFRVRRE